MEENIKIVSLDNNNSNIIIKNKETNTIEKSIYEKVLQNEMLKDVPLELQNDKLVQDDIRREVNEIIELKEKTDKILDAEKDYGNQTTKDVYKGNFHNAKWIIPVVLDQHYVYALNCINEDNDNNENEKENEVQTELLFGDVLKEQSDQMISLFKLYKSYGKNEISLESFYNKFNQLTKAYSSPPITFFNEKNIPKAKVINPENYEQVIRYITFDKDNYKLRVSKGRYTINIEDKNKTNEITLSSNESLYIVGFLFSPSGNINTEEAFNNEIKDISKININLDTSYYIRFENAKSENNFKIDDIKYKEIIKKLIPTQLEVVKHFYEKNPNNNSLEDVNKYMSKWNYSFENIDYDSFKLILENINNLEFKKSILEKDETECKNDLKFDKLIEFIYKYIKYQKCNKNKISYLNNSFDEGLYYYINEYAENIKKQEKYIEKNKNKENINDLFEDKFDIKELKDSFGKNYTFELDYDLSEETLNKNLKDASINVYNNYFQSILSLLKKDELSEINKETILSKKENKEEKKLYFKIPKIKSKEFEKIITNLNTIKTYQEKLDLIYLIIKNDGLLINNWVYSIKYGEPFICGHWYYKMLVDEASTNEDRQRYLYELLTIYGDKQESSKGEENCKFCGVFIDQSKKVNTTFIPDWGVPLKYDDAYELKKTFIEYEHTLKINPYDQLSENVKNCNSGEFKEEIKIRNITDNNSIMLLNLGCKFMNAILSIIDINIHQRYFIEILYVCLKEINEYISYEKFVEEQQTNLISTNKKTLDINTLYKIELYIKFTTLVMSHLLWFLRILIPQTVPGNNAKTKCSFFGFDSIPGFQYLLCVVSDAKMLKKPELNTFFTKNEIFSSFKFWEMKIRPNYRNAYFKKKDYYYLQNKNTENERLDINVNYYEKLKNIFETFKIEKDYDFKNILNEKDLNKKLEFYNNIYYKNSYFTKLILDYKNNILNENYKEISKEIVVSCCPDNPKKYKISLTGTKILYEYIKNNLRYLSYNEKYNDNSGIKNFYVNIDKSSIVNKNLTPINLLDIPNEWINFAFMRYCHSGPSKGEIHFFEENNKCIKCGFSKEQLENEKFSNENFVSLLNIIYEKHLEKIKKEDEIKYYTPSSTKDKNLDNLLNSISNNLEGKDKEARIKKIRNILNNLDNFNNIYKEDDSKTIKEKILFEQEKEIFIIRKLKNYINIFFRKNVSKVKNGYKVNHNIEDKKNVKLNQFILDDKLWLEKFLTETNKKIFQKIKFIHNSNFIDNLVAKMPLYNTDYTKIIKSSKYTNKNLINFLKSYLIDEMFNFISIISPNESILASFYENIFQKIENDKKIINMSDELVKKWEDTIREDNKIKNVKAYDAIEGKDINPVFKENILQSIQNPLEKDKFKSDQEINEEQEYYKSSEEDQYLEERAVQEGIKGDQEISDYIQNQKEERLLDEEQEKEIYNNEILQEGENVLDVGTDYGEPGQGIDNEGAVLNDVAAAELWDGIRDDSII